MDANRFNSFGDGLKYYRKKRQLTEHKLAQMVGCSEEMIVLLEQNRYLPDLYEIFDRFFPALGIEKESDAGLEIEVLVEQAQVHKERRAIPHSTPPIIVVVTSERCSCTVLKNIGHLDSGHELNLANLHPGLTAAMKEIADISVVKAKEYSAIEERLTTRLAETLSLKSQRMTDEQIAESMNVDLETVKKYLKRIRERLGVSTTREAVCIWQIYSKALREEEIALSQEQIDL